MVYKIKTKEKGIIKFENPMTMEEVSKMCEAIGLTILEYWMKMKF